jgi:hypothetical protein
MLMLIAGLSVANLAIMIWLITIIHKLKLRLFGRAYFDPCDPRFL